MDLDLGGSAVECSRERTVKGCKGTLIEGYVSVQTSNVTGA
jgi:hypothetical protein